MAKLISEKAASAFNNNRNFKLDNTRVEVKDNETSMYLFDNKIAWKNSEGMFFSMCGWATRTTKDRLSALGIQIGQRNYQQYWLNSYEGKPMEISSYNIYEV